LEANSTVLVDLGAAEDAAPRSIPTIQKVENYLTEEYFIRFNEVTGEVEWQKKNMGLAFKPVKDYEVNSVVRQLVKLGVKTSANMVRNVLLSDFTPIYNPFKSYLEAREDWDGETDYIQLLAETVNTTNNELWHICFRKWLVAMVGSLMQDDVINHTVIVFSGAQGVGKTTWMLNLVPHDLKDYCFSGTINPANKDTLVQLSECMLINMDELENLNRTEIGALKEIITKSGIRIRRPYGHSNENLPRRASFAGSVNGKEFLSDTTGSRRFLCFEVNDIKYSHSIPMDQVYAQALHLFKNSFQYWFTAAEIKTVNTNNEQYRIMSVEEELLMAHFKKCTKEEAQYFQSTTDLAIHLAEKAKVSVTNSMKTQLGRALRANGFTRIKKGGIYVYALQDKEYRIASSKNHYIGRNDAVALTG
jgi:predicted P-loop ATPase